MLVMKSDSLYTLGLRMDYLVIIVHNKKKVNCSACEFLKFAL